MPVNRIETARTLAMYVQVVKNLIRTQQEPQFPWSLTTPMVEQCIQRFLASKCLKIKVFGS